MGGKGKVDRSERFFLSPFFKRAREKIPGDDESPTSVSGGKGRTTFACPSSTEKKEEEEEAQSRKLRLEAGGGGGRRQEFFTLTLKVCARGKEGRPFGNFFSFSTLTTSTRPRKVIYFYQSTKLAPLYHKHFFSISRRFPNCLFWEIEVASNLEGSEPLRTLAAFDTSHFSSSRSRSPDSDS